VIHDIERLGAPIHLQETFSLHAHKKTDWLCTLHNQSGKPNIALFCYDLMVTMNSQQAYQSAFSTQVLARTRRNQSTCAIMSGHKITSGKCCGSIPLWALMQI
jgi:hypothetical protein